jgi:hypothetical protein
MINKIIYFFFILFFCSCAGTISTVNYRNQFTSEFKKAYIISSENSQYIKFKFGTIMPYGYIPPIDDAAEKNEIIGNTDTIIKQELEKYGIQSIIGKKGDSPEDFDLIVEYSDTWRWDFKKILDKLEINFISPKGDSLLAKSTYNIYKNKEMHNFPTPEKEVPKMIKELLNK